MASRMNKPQRKKWLTKLKIYNNFWMCTGCHKQLFPFKEPKAIVDHIDNDSDNTIKENLQILCRGCNRIKNPRISYKSSKITTQSEATNQRAEPAWRKWVETKVESAQKTGDGFPVDDAIFAGAELFKISPERIDLSYLKKITSTAGKFTIHKNEIFFKKHFL